MNTDAIESMVRDVLSRMNSLQDGIRPRQPRQQTTPFASQKLATTR